MASKPNLEIVSARKVDDAVRERHGVSAREWNNEAQAHIQAVEGERYVFVETSSISGVKLTPWQARYFASRLYRLSRRIRQRTESASA